MADPYFEPFQADQQLRMGQQQMERSAQLFPAQLQHQLGLGRLAMAEAQQKEAQVAADKLVAQRMQARMAGGQQAGGKPPEMSEMAQGLAEDAMSFIAAGDPMRGNQLLTSASQLLSRSAQASKAKVEQARTQAIMQQKQVDDLARLTSGVRDEQSWRQALAWWQRTHEGEQVSPEFEAISRLPYSPQLMRLLQDGATSVKDKIAQQMKKLELAEREKHDRAMEGLQRARVDQGERRTRAYEERQKNLEKTGGKANKVNVPGYLISAANDAIKRRFPELELKSDRSEMAHAVAAKAAQMQQDTPGLDINTALYRAVEEEGKNITKETVGQSTILGKKVPFTGQEQTAYRGPGATAASPMKIPANGAAGLVSDRWYQTPKGVLYFDGKNFSTQPSSGAGAPPSDDMMDEDEEE